MSENPSGRVGPAAVGPSASEASEANLRGVTILAYVLFLIAWVNGITAIAGVIIAYVKRRDADGTVWRSHFDNLIVVFWVMAAAFVLGMLSWPLAIGEIFLHGVVWHQVFPPWPPLVVLPFVFWLLVFPLLFLWYLYRVIRGLVHASEDRPY
jgi:uncharacterized membrane protein